MALSLKQKLFDYFAQRHFDLMTPEQRARFDDYATNEDFLGHMKYWNDNYKGTMLPDFLSAVVAGVANDHQITNDEWEILYDAFQETFQAMDSAKTPSVGIESPYKKATKDFVAKYFGDSSKTFTTTSATTDTETVFVDLETFLRTERGALEMPFKMNMQNIFKDDFTYDKLLSDLGSKKYNSDLKFRKQLESIIEYMDYYQKYPDPSYLPTAVATPARTVSFAGLDPDHSKWYTISNKNRHISQFKNDFSEIFDTLLTKSSVRSDFLAMSPDIISTPLTKAIEQTDYENKDSKDFLPAKYPDEKNWMQQIEDWKNDTYEDYLRKFTNPSRGTRVYFSPWSQNIIKAFDKAKIKPTDGLEGILAKRNDISGNLKSSTTSSDHFGWFADTIEKLKNAGMGKAVEGALRNGSQMRHLVSGIIAEAVEQGKEKEAKTALEILSVAKYGLLSSRTMDAINQTDFTLFSDKNLSFNQKNEAIQAVNKGVDLVIKKGLQAAGYAVTGAYNLFQHSRTKIGNDISNNPVLKKAHDKWDREDQFALQNKQDSNARLHIDMKLDNLALGNGLSGYVIANETDLANAETDLSTMPAGAAYDNLKADIDLYKDSKKRQDEVTNWDENHPDPYKKLIAYWDMLETTTKTHAFTLGSMSVKRKAMLADWVNGNSPAQNIAKQYLQNYGDIRA